MIWGEIKNTFMIESEGSKTYEVYAQIDGEIRFRIKADDMTEKQAEDLLAGMVDEYGWSRVWELKEVKTDGYIQDIHVQLQHDKGRDQHE